MVENRRTIGIDLKSILPNWHAMNKQLNSTNIFDDDDVVISGLAGVYPKSENAREFCKNLFAKKDLTSEVDPVWKSGKNRYLRTENNVAHIFQRSSFQNFRLGEGPQFFSIL